MHQVVIQRDDASEGEHRARSTEAGSGDGWGYRPAEPPTVAGRAGEMTVRVPLRELVVRSSPRAAEDSAHIRRLAETEDELPPILVLRPTMQVIDGAHRLRAAELRGRQDIEVRFVERADDDEAFVLAVRSNVAHGLPLSLAERKAAARRIVETYPRWSDRAVATVVGLSHRTVGAVRREVVGRGQVPTQRVGRDGRTRPVDPTLRRQRAAELIKADPSTSNREIARMAELSPATVRDVRRQLDRGSPVHGPVGRSAAADTAAGRASSSGEVTDLISMIRVLRSDPSVRFTEAGRALLHYLELHRRTEGEWGELVGQLPEHSLRMVQDLAERCSRDWKRLGALAGERARGRV